MNVANILDPNRQLFHERIMSRFLALFCGSQALISCVRTECPNISVKSLTKLFPNSDSMVAHGAPIFF